MKINSLSKTLLFAASIMTFGSSCTCEKKAPSDHRGPQQDQFEHCNATDAECEEGASSSEAVQTKEADPVVVEEVAPVPSPVVQEVPAAVAPEVPQTDTVSAPAVTPAAVEESAPAVDTASAETSVQKTDTESEK